MGLAYLVATVSAAMTATMANPAPRQAGRFQINQVQKREHQRARHEERENQE